MRLTSLIALAVVVLGIGYVAIFKQDWIKELLGQAKGYHGAKSPQEAMDFFAKAVKERDYETAAKYVEGGYAKELERAHSACRALGKEIDWLNTWLAGKAFATKDTVSALYGLDPFPKNFHTKKIVKEEGAKAWGEYESEPVDEFTPRPDLRNVDPKMFICVLGHVCSNPNVHPYNPIARNFNTVELVKVGDGADKAWKLKIDVNNDQQHAIGYFLTRQARYLEGLTSFNQSVNNGRYASRKELENEFKKVLIDAK